MATKDKALPYNLDHGGLLSKNRQEQSVATLPSTTYPRIVLLTSDNTWHRYTPGVGWEEMGSGSGSGGVVETIAEGTGITVDDTDPANPVVAVDTSTISTKSYADSKVADAINDSTTDVAPSQNAVFDALALKAPVNSPAFTGTPTAPTPATSDNTTKIATMAAVQAAIGAFIAASDVEVFKGSIDCSTNPNYPAADAGHVYRVSVAGKIGGGSGVNVEAGDRLECTVDASGAGTHASVGSNWMISQVNIDGAVTGPASSTSGNIPTFNGTGGKTIQDSGTALSDLAPKNSPALTGNPTAPTPSTGDADTSIATTAFVKVRGYAADIGDGTTEDITVTHNLNTTDIKVSVRLKSTGEEVDTYNEATGANTAKIYFPTGAPPSSNQYRVIILGVIA